MLSALVKHTIIDCFTVLEAGMLHARTDSVRLMKERALGWSIVAQPERGDLVNQGSLERCFHEQVVLGESMQEVVFLFRFKEYPGLPAGIAGVKGMLLRVR